MYVNSKKSIKLKNRTKYFSPATCRTHVQFSSPDSYQSRQIKIEGYETRLYWQYRYCDEHNGSTFFYTLTYNDEHIPTYLDENCFDYEDLRDLFTGGFRKQLLRKYGATFKYFVGAELGDGKGERGLHNNPHYHVLFFIEDAKNDRFPYKKIEPSDFRHLVRLYWQGFDEDTDGYHDYRDARYGIAREGENLGLVTDFRACCYCAKYVCKDVNLKKREADIEQKLRFKYKNQIKKDNEFHKKFFYETLYSMFNIPMNAKHTEWTLDEVDLIERILPGYFNLLKRPDQEYFVKPSVKNFTTPVLDIVSKMKLWNEYYKAFDSYLEDRVHLDINEYRNRYCNKARISQGVGDYALEFIDDKMNPSIKVPSKKGFKNRPISMYYYRKLYTDVYTDKKGSNIRVLNDLGIDYKVNRLDKQIKKKVDTTLSYLQILLNNSNLYDKMLVSDVNTDVFMSYTDFKGLLNSSLKDITLPKLLERYAEYKLVYEDRYFPLFETDKDGNRVFTGFPIIDCNRDYRRFLVPSYFSVSRSDLRLDSFLDCTPEDWLPYGAHSYFLQYRSLFNVFDLCSDYFFIQGDNKAQADAEEIAATKRFHSQQKVKEFYSYWS